MIPRACKRLAEVDFPIALVSKHAAREKEARCGHIPKIHIWPAARPTSSSRAVLLALLLPDPEHEQCPKEFKEEARWLLARVQGGTGSSDQELRKALLKFIGDFSSWDLAASKTYLEVGRALVKAAHGEEPPLLVDPFAGGGSVPLEALRLGCETFASDLNPVACLILKVVLADIPEQGPGLAAELRRVGDEVKKQAKKELAALYPPDSDGATPITYLWARTVRCESPNCGAEIPLMRSFWLCKKAKRKRALRYRVEKSRGAPPRVRFEVFQPNSERDVPGGTVSRAKATCVCCGAVLPPDRVRTQLAAQRGGADVMFDSNGRRRGGARVLAVVLLKPGRTGRHYRAATEGDYEAVRKAQARVAELLEEWERGGQQGLCPVPDESLPLMSGTFNVPIYGMNRWCDIFAARQTASLITFARLIANQASSSQAAAILALSFSKMVDMNNALSSWQPHAEIPAHMLTRFAIPMKWDFAEAVPISESSGSLESAINRSMDPLPSLTVVERSSRPQVADATDHPLPDQAGSVWFTDPPYYFAIPYADISDFFFVWLKRALPGNPLLQDPLDPGNPLTPKERELCEMAHWDSERFAHKDKAFFEEGMRDAFAEGRRVLHEDGIGAVVFAHKTTEGWEALLSGMIRGGWTITGSWPIATEMGSRLRARESAALATSVHLICRPRSDDAPVGDWAEVLRELPRRVGDWMKRLEGEGVRGADLVFACIGPALEIFSRYRTVETAEGREVKLDEYLEKVWEVVGRTALGQVLGTAEAKSRNGAAGAVEEDARLSALFLWALQSTAVDGDEDVGDGGESDDDADGEDEEEAPSRGKGKGFTLVFDVVRRFAQPLGIELPKWEGRVIETKKGVVRLLPIGERAKYLFGKDGAGAVADQLERKPATDALQRSLFLEFDAASGRKSKGRGRGRREAGVTLSERELEARPEATTLDRVHVAMLLQRSGRTNALRALIRSEQERGPDFVRLANALSALYPKGSEEKRLVDAMLLAVPR